MVGLLLDGLGVGLSLFVIGRLFFTWRVTPAAASNRISIFSEKVSYPVANLDAVVVLALALAGLAVIAILVRGAVREVAAARRFRRGIRAESSASLPGVFVVADERPLAFCAGLIRPRVYVSSGAVALLDPIALRAVLAHESEHARRRDPLRLAGGRVLARALFFVPGLARLARHQQSLAELGADERAVEDGPENRSGLARAMLAFTDSSASPDPVGIDPGRIDFLLGEPPRWPFPLALCLMAAGVLCLLAAVAALAGQLAAGSATLAPPVLSGQPCIVMLALIPAILSLICARVVRSFRLRRRA